MFLLQAIDAISVKDALEKWIKKNGKPMKIITDGGKQYKSNLVEGFIKANNIKHVTTTPYNPESNGSSERINQVIRRVLVCTKGENITKVVKIINQALQHSYHRCIGKSPYEILKGTSIFDPLKRSKNVNLKEVVDRSDRCKMTSVMQRNKTRRNFQFQVGDKVMLRNPIQMSKFEPKWKGPYEIIKLKRFTAVIRDSTKELHVNLRKIRPW